MQIFIDESGPFVVPKAEECSVCCVSALVIPDRDHAEIITKFETLKFEWGIQGKEAKGRELGEHQISAVIQMLGRYEVIFQTVAIDMGSQTEEGIERHKQVQADKITENVTSEHKPPLVEALKKLQARLRAMANQLYVQSVLLTELIETVLQTSTLYYAQRKPQELGHFRWVIDAKGQSVTPYENLWSKVVMPFLQSRSLREPFIQLRQADYSAFGKFCAVQAKPPRHLRAAAGNVSPFRTIDLNAILQNDLAFLKSESEAGLQLIDILCNTVRRATKGNLGKIGWEMIGCLAVQPQKGRNAVQMVDLTTTSRQKVNKRKLPYAGVIQQIDLAARSMLSRSLLEEGQR